MLAEDANMQKQKKREEQLRNWREREQMALASAAGTAAAGENNLIMDPYDRKMGLNNNKQREIRVKFPKGCVFLAACSSGDIDEVRQYLKMGVNINTTNIDGLTALHQACIDANLDMVKFLIENQADIDVQDNEGWTPLHAAVSVGNLDVVKYLISQNARLDVCNNDSDLPVDLVDTSNPQMKEMKDYLEDEMRSQAINTEYEKQKEELMMWEDAQKIDFKERVHAKTGATPLHVAAAKGYLRVIEILLQRGVDVNSIDHDGWTPLHAAAHWEQIEACKILVQNGADCEAKTFSGQTAFDVCDKEMANKLRILQNNSSKLQLMSTSQQKSSEKLADVTSMNNQYGKVEPRIRRASDELANKTSTINRLPNDAKSSIGDREKKQDKILLSPISAKTFDVFNSDSENVFIASDKKTSETTEEPIKDDQFTFDKENINRSNSNTTITNNYSNSASNPVSNNGNTVTNQQNETLASFKSSLNRGKSGLQESLKSLSAQVKLKIDEEEKNDKQQISSSEADNKMDSNNGTINTTPVSPTTSTSTNNNTLLSISNPSSVTTNTQRPYLEKRWGNTPGQNENPTYKRKAGNPSGLSSIASPDNQQPQTVTAVNPIINQLINNVTGNSESSTRRYSSAPIASKDEQAELIRKQKAKLERHFRRSTQAVSYEDIKSAEASIKNSLPSSSSQNVSSLDQSTGGDTPSLTSPTTVNGPSSASPFSNYNTGTSTATSPTPSIPTPITQAPPPPLQGVSSLSSLFAEKINKANSTSPSSTTSLYSATAAGATSPISSAASSFSNSTTTTAVAVTPSSSNTSSNNSTTENVAEKDVIANDIETDKLLNAIEKSKGFSDQLSTTAARRLRNKGLNFPAFIRNDRFQSSSQTSSGEDSLSAGNSTGNNKKRTKLVWNENRLEVYRMNPGEQEQNTTGDDSSDASTTGCSTNKTTNNIGGLDALDGQQPILEENGNSSSNEGSGGSNMTYTSSLPNRQLYRFGADGTNNTSLNPPNLLAAGNTNRSTIKRSISQVPTTSNLDNSRSRQNGNHNGSEFASSFDANNKIFDYQAAYEAMKKENDQLKQTLMSMQKELDEKNTKLQAAEASLDKRERRTYERRISELESELEKAENLRSDNHRLKEENAALIRVISKLSK